MIMDELLCVLVCHFKFLYKDLGFRIVDSMHDSSSFGNGIIQLSDTVVEFQMVIDRGKFDLMVRPANPANEWFSIVVVADLLEDIVPSLAYCEYAATLSRIYPRVAETIASNKWPSFVRKLKRRKKMFADA